jgi:hypothetical protein
MRALPTLVAAAFAAAYVIVAPPSVDLAAQLFRAHLFGVEGFGLWDNLWYAGHDIVGYGILFPAVASVLSPQLAAAIAATATAAVFEPLARRHFGTAALPGAILFGAATAIDLYTGRLAFAFGALPALGAVAALDGGAVAPACALAALSALCSPVAALFAGLAAGGYALGAMLDGRRGGPGDAPRSGPHDGPRDGARGGRRLAAAFPGAAVLVAAIAPIALLAVAFPEGGVEPFAVGAMAPIVILAGLLVAIAPAEAVALRAGAALYALATIGAFVVPTPVGGNIARLGALLAAPVAALEWGRRRTRAAALAVIALLYLGWQAPVRDILTTAGDPTTTAGYYRPLLAFLERAARSPAAPFRIEIPLTRTHWEAWEVATRFPIARGWERQLDIADNPIFYDGRLNADTYRAWLHDEAVRFIALPDAALDASARREAALIRGGLPYLRLVMRSAHWRVYAVADATPIAGGVLALRALGPESLTLSARAAGTAIVRVHFTAYWAIGAGAGCVSAAGPFTRVTAWRAGTLTLVTRFAPGRIGARSPRCT